MTLKELQATLLRLQDILSTKGYARPDVFASINGETTLFMANYRVNPNDSYDDTKRLSSWDFDEFYREIIKIPDVQELKRREFLSRLGHLVEDAESLGIDIPLLRPLFETYRNNLLEHHQ